MPATRYKIWHVGGPVGRGAMSSIHVATAGVAKAAGEGMPYAVANELICSQLARTVLLPVPPGFLIERDGIPYHVSLNFNLSGEDLPPADAAMVAQKHPQLACGIILFDMWILNPDRHNGNLAYDQSRDAVEVFDHSHAFYTSPAAMDALRNQTAIGGHCLAAEITQLAGMVYWAERVKLVPAFFIKEVVQSAASVGLPADHVDFCAQYLLERQSRLLDIARANRVNSPKVQPNLWDELDQGGS